MEILDSFIFNNSLYIKYESGEFTKSAYKPYGFISPLDTELLRYGKVIGEVQDIYDNTYLKLQVNNYYKIPEQLRDKILNYQFAPLFYLKDNNVRYSNNYSKYRIWYWDIETKFSMNENKVSNPKSPIISLSFFDSILKTYYVISWHKVKTSHILDGKYEIKKENIDGENITYIYVKDELNLLKVFISLYKKYNPMLLVGWFSNFYDLPYLIARLEINGIDLRLLSPVNASVYVKKISDDNYIVHSTGLYSIELNEVIEKFSFDKFAKMGLGAVATQLGLGNKLEVDLDKDYEDHYEHFLKYNINDVRLTYKIDLKYHAINLLILLHSITSTPFNHILQTSKIVESALLFNSNKIIVPNKKPFKNYQGAIVLNPLKSGILHNVLVIDANSMYPTSTITFNISPDTLICSYDDINNVFERSKKYSDVYDFIVKKIHKKLHNVKEENSPLNYTLNLLKENNIDYIDTGFSSELNEHGYIFYHHNYQFGVYTKFLKEYYDMRVEYKSKMKKLDPSSEEYSSYDAGNLVFKLILNSTYGANGYEHFILYDPRIAETITFFARRLLMYAKEFVEKRGYEVEYGDTDSLFIILKNQSFNENEINKEADSLLQELNSSIYDWHIKKYISNDIVPDLKNYLGFKNEHILNFVYFGNVKKRYYGLNYPDSKGVETTYVRGMNVIRKDSPELIKKLLNQLVYKIIHGNITMQDFLDAYETIKSAPLNQIGILKSFNKSFNDYKVDTQHLKALKFAQEALHMNFANSDTPLMFYIKLNTVNIYKNFAGVICINEDKLDIYTRQKIFTIDYNTLFLKQIITPLREFDGVIGLANILSELEYKFTHDVYQQSFIF